MSTQESLIVIGSGPAGLTAAIYAARGGLSPLVIAGPQPGGQLTITTDVEDFPGFPDGIQGPELMDRMRQQATRFGVRFIDSSVTAVNFQRKPFAVMVGETQYEARAVVIATGASAKWLGLESEQRLIGHGVSSCAVCDGFFFRGKPIAINGGGDTAAKEALYLAKICERVTLIHRRPELRAQQVLQDRLRATPNIDLRLGYEVEEVLGDTTVTGVRIRATTGEQETVLVSGFFVAIGHIPNTVPFCEAVRCDAAGYILSEDGVHTSVPGIFVAGDVQDRLYRQAVTAAGMGCRAAMEAAEYLETHD
ncbi:MAG: thioredoxin-disulfide reductase [Patescibacteria group bacterium]